jgi:hypothetical protein
MAALRTGRRSMALAAVIALSAVGAPTVAATDRYDVALVLAVDASMSIGEDERALQYDGYAAAFRDSRLATLVGAGPNGQIAVAFVEFSDAQHQKIILPWTIVDGAAAAGKIARALTPSVRSPSSGTSISAALQFSQRLLMDVALQSDHMTVDVSGDGVNSNGPDMASTRDQLLARGVTINGLPIILRGKPWLWEPEIPDVEAYYSNCVIGGSGSFSIPVRTPADFATATLAKLLREIAAAERIELVALRIARPRIDCAVREKPPSAAQPNSTTELRGSVR